jgi:hypothetical protein
MEMDVFDSFAGLPQSDSAYYSAGDFAGSLEEVKRNVATFGDISVANFHEGFFCDSLPQLEAPSFNCFWMDVDLSSSASDVMSVLPKLSKYSCVFSHECYPSNFVEGEIVSPLGPDYVVPEIKAGFLAAGRSPVGRHIGGCMGAFWDKDAGVPPLAAPHLTRICDIAVERDAQVTDIQNELQVMREHVASLKAEIGSISMRLAHADEENRRYSARAEELDALLTAVLDSRSWRATAPLRKLMGSLRNWSTEGRRSR